MRTTLDLPFEGKTRDEQYALGDLHLDGELAETDFHIFSSEHGFMGLFPMGDRRFRLIASNPLSRASKDTAPTLKELQAIYDQRSQIPARFHDMSWSSWFRINSRMVARLKVGRLLLGGDAAHIHSPAGAQGMNTGIQDMINLAWKLALVLKGQAPPRLLDTYEQERLPVIRDVLAKTEGMTNVIGAGNVGPWAQEAEMAQVTIAARMCQLAIGYRDSPLSATYLQEGLHAGDRVPDLPVRYHSEGSAGWQEKTLFSLLDPSRFTLLAVRSAESGAAPADLYDAVQPWRQLIGVVELAPAPEAARERFQAVFGRSDGVFLVRPDGYVGFASGEYAWARQLDAYCRLWLSAPAQVHTHAG